MQLFLYIYFLDNQHIKTFFAKIYMSDYQLYRKSEILVTTIASQKKKMQIFTPLPNKGVFFKSS